MKIFLAAASAALAFAASPAAAETLRSVVVSYGDLDLTQPADQKTLERRVEFAVRDVCRMPAYMGARAYAEEQACLTEARAKASEQIAEVTPAQAPELASRI